MIPRVLIFRSDLLPRSETFIAAQAAALRRYQPVFIGLRSCENSLPLPSPVVLAGRFIPGERLLFQQFGFAPDLTHAARAQHASLIHAHFALDAAAALPLQQKLHLPLVVTLHGYDVMCSDETHRRTRPGRLYLARRQQLWSRAALFICVSNAIRERALERGFPANKLRVLPIGIDTHALAFTPEYPPINSSRQQDVPTILFVGRLVEKKGCAILLQAMERVQERLPKAKLLIAGDGPERQLLELLAAEATHGTQFLGVQTPDQVRALMRSASCLAAPSITAADGDSEGLPTVLCEALALGLPVASTFHSGIPELITHRQHGLLSQERDVESLAQYLVELCTDTSLALELRRAGRIRVEHSFNLIHQTCALELLYDEAVSRHPSIKPGKSSTHSITAAKVAVVIEQGSAGDPPSTHAEKAAPDSSGYAEPVASGISSKRKTTPRLRHQAAWLLSGSGTAILFQALYFLLIGRMLGAREYGAFVGVVALVNILSQFSSLGMEMVLLRTIARNRAAFAVTWARALTVSACGFVLLLLAVTTYGHFFLPPMLRQLLPYLALSDALFGKLTQLGSRALQGAELARWSAKLLALTNAARAATAALLFLWAASTHAHVSLLTWVRLYSVASLLVALLSFVIVTRLLGRPRWAPVRRAHLSEGLAFSFSSSSISVYNDIDKTLLVSHGMLAAAGVYAAAYRVIDVVSTPIVSLFAAASPRLFRQGAQEGPAGAARAVRSLLRWAGLFGLAAAPLLACGAPLFPHLFGHSFTASIGALRFLCLLPLLRALHYAWGTAITACTSQWVRTGTQAGAALLNLLLNLWLIPRWGWQGAAVVSLITDGTLALSTFVILRVLVMRQQSRLVVPIRDALSQH